MAVIKKTKSLGEDREKREPLCIVGGNVNWCSHVENSVEYSTPGYLSKGNKITYLKRYLHPCVHWSIIYNSRDMETICVHQWIKDVVHIQNGIKFSTRKEGIPAICKNMNRTWGFYATWNKSNTVCFHLYVKSKKKQKPKSKMHRNKEQNDNCQRQEVGKMGEDSQKIQTCGYKQSLGI